jgi:hypothetical protein
MTTDEFRHLALSMPEVNEGAHMGHPDFRIGSRIFATLGFPDQAWAMIKLTPEQQAAVVAAEPHVFTPAAGGWGRRGSTNVRLGAASVATVKDALTLAWSNLARGPAVKRATNRNAPARGAGRVAAKRPVRRR